MNRLICSISGLAMTMAMALVGGASAEEQPSGQQGKSTVELSKIWPSKASGPPEAVVYDAAAAMQYFRTLSGVWVTGAPSEAVTAVTGSPATAQTESFKTIAAGSTVRQTLLQGTPFEMEILYHMDGPDTLLLTHYCAAKNVPELKFRKTDKAGEIHFDFAGGTNMNPQVDSHARTAIYRIIDKDTFEMDSTGYVKGKPEPAHAVYKRKSAGT